ncbi:MAG: hypothetical protein LC723_09640 [Actinobacteria bacterium]|nr:hypothetical protein [Actinomycetota bacterium]
MEAMIGRKPTQAQTLPADGTVLEELIENMQNEYGTPSTPQEYRLIIKVPGPDAVVEKPVTQPRSDGDGPTQPRRRRRRGKRRRGGAARADAPDAPEPGPVDVEVDDEDEGEE